MPQRVAITGASGLIGGALSAFLSGRGDEVLHVVRREPRTASEIGWDPRHRQLDPAALSGVTAVVNLAGANVGGKRWTPAYKQEIFASRVDSTHTIASALADLHEPVRLVNASAIGIYGSDRGEEVLTEDSEPGQGFLADVVRAWESATKPAADAGLPVAMARTGLVMSPDGGAFERLLTLGRLGLLGPLGSGRQYWSWVTLRDVVRGYAHLIDREDVTGPVNLVGPAPAHQADVARAVATELHRPSVLPAPGFALKAVLGEFADDVLGSARVMPSALTASGFTFEHDTLEQAAAWLVDQAGLAA
ncbi:MAG: TIGR01777 family oxidoreductase [Oryzihumus sp.]